MTTLFKSFRHANKQRLVQTVVVFILFFLLVSGGVLVYSVRIKATGDKEYKNQSYVSALARYQEAKSYWFPEKVNYHLRDKDLYDKINKAQIMVDSANNYFKGINAYANEQYSEAKNYLSKLALNDPHYQDARKMLEIIEKQQSKQIPISLATSPVVKQVQINCTGPDGKQFKTTQVECDKLNNYWAGAVKASAPLPVDNNKPVFDKLELSSNKVGRGQEITVYVFAHDDESGLDHGDIRAADDSGNLDIRADEHCDRVDEKKLECVLNIPKYGKIGTWHIAHVNIDDVAGHQLHVSFENGRYTFAVE